MSEWPEHVSEEISEAAWEAVRNCDLYALPEHIAVAQSVLELTVQRLRNLAGQEFDQHGPRDRRGAAIWDCAAYIDEHLLADPLRRRPAGPNWATLAEPPVVYSARKVTHAVHLHAHEPADCPVLPTFPTAIRCCPTHDRHEGCEHDG